jgi:DNA-binding response OmpR family regulator
MLQNTTFTPSQNIRSIGVDLDDLPKVKRPRVLIVDDDIDYLSLMKSILRQADFDVSGISDHKAALEKCSELNPDVILLDVMMPEEDGYGIFQRLRNITQAPVIFVSAAERSEHITRALEQGADDYVSKPFHNAEIVARIRRVLRQSQAARPIKIRFFPEIGLRIDLESHEASLQGKLLHLLPREYSLLNILAENAPHNVTYEKIAQHIWGDDSHRRHSHLKNIAFWLRRKIEPDPLHPRLVVNNRSFGYQLVTQPSR